MRDYFQIVGEPLNRRVEGVELKELPHGGVEAEEAKLRRDVAEAYVLPVASASFVFSVDDADLDRHVMAERVVVNRKTVVCP